MERRAFLQTLLAALTVSVSQRVLADGSISTVESQEQQPLITVQIPPGKFVTLCMHDVRDDVSPTDKDPYAINTQRLTALFDWMQQNGWNPVSLQQILDAHAGKSALPDNAVLLSWDDGLASIYTKVFPLLKAFNYPALFALETGWLTQVQRGEMVDYQGESFAGSANDAKAADKALKIDEQEAHQSDHLQVPHKVIYNGIDMGANHFVTWAQAREMHTSGLVEYATHTHDLHHGILANPQGNVEPSAITRQYLATLKRHETDSEFHARISNDLNTSATIIEREVGVRPRAIVWPFGAMTPEIEDIAGKAGIPVSFGLGDAHPDTQSQSPHSYGRMLVMNDPSPVSVESQIEQSVRPLPLIERAIQVDLDYVYDPNPEVANRNLGKLLDRVKAMRIRTVYLQAFADPGGTGTPSALYFPNRVLPMRADLFNRVAWQLRTRAGVRVFAWLPMLAYKLPDPAQQKRLAVKVMDAQGGLKPAHRDYERLSPFLPETAKVIGDIYADLGKNTAGIAGLLIHDDAYLAEDEDATASTPEARWPGTNRTISNTPLTASQKTQALIDFGKVVTQRLRYHVDASTNFTVARNLYANVVLDPSAEGRFAQALAPFVQNYDHVALMAMPYLYGTDEPPAQWLKKLATAVAEQPGGLQKVVFELQTKNWHNNEWIDGETLKSWMQLLIRMGGKNLAYYPDDFLHNHPPFKPTFEGISLNEFPYYPVKP